MGLGMQMIGWDTDLCLSADRGYHVVRFDNLDSGHSTHLNHVQPPSPARLAARRIPSNAYTLTDLASDTIGL